MRSAVSTPESFTPEEEALLTAYFGNVDLPVFVLRDLPEVVKGALFARYSRSAKSVRRLFLDEFSDSIREGQTIQTSSSGPGETRADQLYNKVFNQYGDDSVAQLGGAHIACEGVSNVLTKILERGRLMSYLEQSTRYVPYTARPDGKWKYVIPTELTENTDLTRYSQVLDRAFETYTRWIEPLQRYFTERFPRSESDSDAVYKAVIRAKALDSLRGLLPAATRSNVGLYGSGQAYEMLLLRMRSHPLSETREIADLMLPELRKVIPAFLQRVDRADRGVLWSNYLASRNEQIRALSESITNDVTDTSGNAVTLTDFDPDGEVKVVAAALYQSSRLSHSRLMSLARGMSTEERLNVLQTYIGNRRNRRHRPSRAFEHATYNFDVLSDYGAFRDLQRHRMLTLEWQDLNSLHGYTRPAAIEDVGAHKHWNEVMDDSAKLSERLETRYSPLVAQYAVSMAYHIRFYLRMNAREAMHIIELRTAPQGHPAYRIVCQQMHRLIADQAGHKAIAEAMTYVDHSDVELARLESERTSERRRQQIKSSGPQQDDNDR